MNILKIPFMLKRAPLPYNVFDLDDTLCAFSDTVFHLFSQHKFEHIDGKHIPIENLLNHQEYSFSKLLGYTDEYILDLCNVKYEKEFADPSVLTPTNLISKFVDSVNDVNCQTIVITRRGWMQSPHILVNTWFKKLGFTDEDYDLVIVNDNKSKYEALVERHKENFICDPKVNLFIDDHKENIDDFLFNLNAININANLSDIYIPLYPWNCGYRQNNYSKFPVRFIKTNSLIGSNVVDNMRDVNNMSAHDRVLMRAQNF